MSTKTKTIQQVGEMVGVKADVTDAILAEIKANQARIKGCTASAHDFSINIHRYTKEPIPEPAPPRDLMFGLWKCSFCGGYVDGHAKHWYDLGLKAGVNL